MTTEDDFQRALDTDPDAHHTRLVFADWLQERGDPRAEGYRALGLMRRIPALPPVVALPGYCGAARAADAQAVQHVVMRAAVLPHDWLEATANARPGWSTWVVQPTRREAEDAAALAFVTLPTARRTELLATSPA